MKSIHDILTAIANCHLDARILLDWCSNSLDFHEVSLWGDKIARWYACQLRAGHCQGQIRNFRTASVSTTIAECCPARRESCRLITNNQPPTEKGLSP